MSPSPDDRIPVCLWLLMNAEYPRSILQDTALMCRCIRSVLGTERRGVSSCRRLLPTDDAENSAAGVSPAAGECHLGVLSGCLICIGARFPLYVPLSLQSGALQAIYNRRICGSDP